MNTGRRTKKKKSKVGKRSPLPPDEIWKKKKYCLIQLVFTDQVRKNPFPKSDVVYGNMVLVNNENKNILYLLEKMNHTVLNHILKLNQCINPGENLVSNATHN